MVVRRVGVGQDRQKNIDLVQAEEMVFFYLCSSFVRNCIIIQSRGAAVL